MPTSTTDGSQINNIHSIMSRIPRNKHLVHQFYCHNAQIGDSCALSKVGSTLFRRTCTFCSSIRHPASYENNNSVRLYIVCSLSHWWIQSTRTLTLRMMFIYKGVFNCFQQEMDAYCTPSCLSYLSDEYAGNASITSFIIPIFLLLWMTG